MAKKKLQTFSADDASDVFTPTVKTFMSAETPISSGSTESASKPTAAPIGETPLESQTKGPSDPKDPALPQTTPKTEKDGSSLTQKESVPKADKANETPAEKTVKPEPAAQPKPVSPTAKTPGNGQPSNIVPIVKPAPKPENKPAVSKTAAAHPTSSDKAPKKPVESKEKAKPVSQTHVELVGFILGKEEYAIEINKVQDINRMVEITRVPKAPDFVEGVMNLRGKVIPVIHLRKRFNLPDKPFDRSSRIIVVEVAGSIMGFIVDAITEVLRIPSHIIEKTPDLVTGIDSEYIMGVGKLQNRLLILIDLGKVLTKKTS